MAYKKQNFKSGDMLYAYQLNAMDEQISKNESDLNEALDHVDSETAHGDIRQAVMSAENRANNAMSRASLAEGMASSAMNHASSAEEMASSAEEMASSAMQRASSAEHMAIATQTEIEKLKENGVPSGGALTAENIETALGYTPANAETVEDLSKAIADLPNNETLIGNVAEVVKAEVPLVKTAQQPDFVDSVDKMTDTSKVYVMPDMSMWAYMLGENQSFTFTAEDLVADALNTNGALLGNGTPNRIVTKTMIDLNAGTVSIYCPDPYQYIVYYYTEKADASYIGKTTFKSGSIDDVLTDTVASGTLDGAKFCRISLRDSASTTVDLSGRIDEFVANVIISQASETSGGSYYWQNTGYSYNQPLDYEDRIVALERALEGVENGTY